MLANRGVGEDVLYPPFNFWEPLSGSPFYIPRAKPTKGPMNKITFDLVWFDSLGAKSSSTLVRTPDVSVLIDPGVAIMQPSFPAPLTKKLYWKAQGAREIRKASQEANVIVISHYHYDHFTDFDRNLYKGKLLLVKNPNEYINDSQRGRAEHFFDNLCRSFGETDLDQMLQARARKSYGNPLDDIPLARDMDFGDYNRRRKELLEKGLKWFRRRVEKWHSFKTIPELTFRDVEVKFPEGREFRFGRTKLRFTPPMFHGIEFSRVGWVFATVIEYPGEKVIHTSDLSGIYIEDYAEWIIQENPTVLILDGPPTYMGFMLIRTNLNRCVRNTCEVIERSKNLRLLVYDHHLLRERRYREKTRMVWETGADRGVKVVTAAEHLGRKPVIDTL